MDTIRGILVLLVLSLAACSSSAPPAGEDAVTSNKIFVTKLTTPVDGLSAYEVIERYRSHWLRKRGPTSINNPVSIQVYVDGSGSPYGTVGALRNLRASEIATITHFNGHEAQFRFGLGNVAGAILVETKPISD